MRIPAPHTIGMDLFDLETPALVLDVGAAERNIQRLAEIVRRSGKRLRPHTKTHKTPLLAHKQIAAGAVGVCCAKLGEVEVMVAGGVPDILLTSEIVSRAAIARLIAAARHARIGVVVDDAECATAIAAAAQAAGLTLPTYVDVNVGQDRTGVAPGQPTVALARHVAGLLGLELAGLQAYEGHLQHVVAAEERETKARGAMQLVAETRRLLADAGLPVGIVTTGGTGTHATILASDAADEVQAGSYVVMDAHYGTVAGLEFEHALTVLTSIVSHTRADTAITDAGLKTLSSDSGMPIVKSRPDLSYAFGGDEHGKIGLREARSGLKLGDKLEVIPSHCDTTINLHDFYYVGRDGKLEAVWPIAARGRIQ